MFNHPFLFLVSDSIGDEKIELDDIDATQTLTR